MEKPEKVFIGEDGFWSKWFSKLLFTLISVKVWGLVAGTWISTYLLLNQKVIDIGGKTFELSFSSTQWVTFNTTIWALIFGMKEVFRISEKRDKNEKAALDKRLETKEKVAAMIQAPNHPSTVKVNTDGTETVGSEPD
ncbi:hypothetical protein SAMN05421640_3215 [Ekhidna lutea]|uniref:Uncharacterized protein n=1 Tax=Ekhidna lutea TaxID=447679 RepID=A0A239LGD9_EKHLU|nr:hypothetical protein [Ekhidna lutea]SNT28978.1 hypothetical protein SAMN05421640_3215 [Ekhidna lutea]